MLLLAGLLAASVAAGQDLATLDTTDDHTIPEAEAQAAGDRHGDDVEGEDDPAEGRSRHRILLRSTELGDDVRVSRIGRHAARDERNHWTCSAPCALRLDPGEYRVAWSAAGLDEEIHVDSDMLLEANGAGMLELVTGVGALVIGGVILTVALLTGEGACFELDAAACAVGNGPVALGVGTFGVLFGLFLMIDSTGFVEVTDF